MESNLDESWKDRAVIESSTDNGFEYGYLQGASDFQEQAIKGIEKIISELPGYINNEYMYGLERAIEIITDLKAK